MIYVRNLPKSKDDAYGWALVGFDLLRYPGAEQFMFEYLFYWAAWEDLQ